MKTTTRKTLGIIVLVTLVCLVGALFATGFDDKKQLIIRDLVRDPDMASIAVVSISRWPNSVNSIVIGTAKAPGVTVFTEAPDDIGSNGQVAEFTITETLLNRKIPGDVSQKFGKFPFPSEFRTWQQKVAGFDARVELYYEPKSMQFVAFIWNNR